VIIDGFTKFAFLKAVRTTKVGPVLKFLDEIFDMFGVTQRLVCDRGSCFTSKRFNEYCNAMGIKVNYNATATPRLMDRQRGTTGLFLMPYRPQLMMSESGMKE
jgi:hypothetical protein